MSESATRQHIPSNAVLRDLMFIWATVDTLDVVPPSINWFSEILESSRFKNAGSNSWSPRVSGLLPMSPSGHKPRSSSDTEESPPDEGEARKASSPGNHQLFYPQTFPQAREPRRLRWTPSRTLPGALYLSLLLTNRSTGTKVR